VAKKSAKSERQAKIDEIRNKQKGSEKRRNYAIVGVCSAVAIAILGIAAVPIIKEKVDLSSYSGKDLAQIGSAASSCQDVTTKKADGNQQHVEEGSAIAYPDAPPAFGTHYFSPATMDRKMYTAADRPELGTLVHNLEHGYTILWYDQTAADNAEYMKQIRAIAGKFPGTTNLRNKFKAAPWTSADESGKSFPDGQHIAFTHWSAGGSGKTAPADQVGAWQYCSSPSGAALADFMKKYPYTDSPEPLA
jgi:hypothetical protein